MYYLAQNIGAGEARIVLDVDCLDIHENLVGEFQDFQVAKEALKSLAGPTVFAVFANIAAGTAFVSEENAVSGNWRGSKYSPSNLFGEFETLEAATEYRDALLREWR